MYLPAASSPGLQSFASPILNLHDTHVEAPWFGANIWTAIVQPVPGGNIPSDYPALELKMTFKDGGAFDFHSTYERIKERLQNALDLARESGQFSSGDGTGALSSMNVDNVHLDELPAYEASPNSPLLGSSERQVAQPRPRREQPNQDHSSEPPGYEEAQRESVVESLERTLRSGQ